MREKLLLLGVVLVAGCGRQVVLRGHGSHALPALLVEGSRAQIGVGTRYDGAYYRIPYPDGDVPKDRGACTDVVVRAYRHVGIDLQRLIHQDVLAAPDAYPSCRGRKEPDTNIDHRRVPNQRSFFRRHGLSLTLKADKPKDWQPGDVVQWRILGQKDHTAILSDRVDGDGFPFVIHNMGNGPQEEDLLREPLWRITGHFRYLPKRTRAQGRPG